MVDSAKYHKIHELQLSFAKMEKACQRFKPEEENTQMLELYSFWIHPKLTPEKTQKI